MKKEAKLHVAKMCMLRRMCGFTGTGRIRSEYHKKVHVFLEDILARLPHVENF